MYRVNPLVDINASVTPAEIMYRLDNIHKNLKQSAIGSEAHATTACAKVTHTPSSAPVTASSNKKANVGGTNSDAQLGAHMLNSLDERIERLKSMQYVDEYDAFPIVNHRVHELTHCSGIVDKVIASVEHLHVSLPPCAAIPYGRVIPLRTPTTKWWTSSADAPCKEVVETIKKVH